MVTKSHAAKIAAERGGVQAEIPEVPAVPAAEEAAASRGRAPAARVNFGGVSASIWANEGEKGTFHTVTFEKRYQEGGEWKTSHSYGPTDLLALSKVADLAVNKIIELQQSRGRSL